MIPMYFKLSKIFDSLRFQTGGSEHETNISISIIYEMEAANDVSQTAIATL